MRADVKYLIQPIYVVLNGIAIRKNSRNFFKIACHTDTEIRKKAKLEGLDRRLDDIPNRD